MSNPIVAGTALAQVFAKPADAEKAVRALRAAGFSDVRVSEHAGDTREEHVPARRGRTADDFIEELCRAGFSHRDAVSVTEAVARGATLLTVMTGGDLETAAAVLRGETVEPRVVSAVDAAPPPRENERRPDGGEGEHVIPLRAEQLDVAKERTTSDAQVRKEVVVEEQTVRVPVRREELVVEREGEPPVRIPVSDRDPNREPDR